MHHAIVASGSRRSANWECAGGPSFTTSNSMRCDRCARKCGGICSPRVRNTRRGNGSARSRLSVRSGRPCCWAFCRRRTASAPSDRCGNYSGFAIKTHSSADHRSVDGQLQRSKNQISIRGLNQDCNHDLKNLFKGAAIVASSKPGPFQEFYAALLAKGMRPEMARLTLARKIATIALIVWKKGVCFDAQYLKPQTA